MPSIDSLAMGSDVARSRRQFLARKLASVVVSALGLNRAGFLATEIAQQVNPICTIPTAFGQIRCKGGHGRLRWRALTFYTEEPETIKWLDGMKKDDLFWDIGANVGLYSIYAAKSSGCRVLAVEPEAQNYALLLENILLNEIQGNVEATNIAVSNSFGLGVLKVHALTKGGAYNEFSPRPSQPEANGQSGTGSPLSQLQVGLSLDDLVNRFDFPYPTRIKIDVDGNEPYIIAGATQVLGHERCASVLIEVQKDDPAHLKMLEQLDSFGFHCVSERSNWDSRSSALKAAAPPVANMIFARA